MTDISINLNEAESRIVFYPETTTVDPGTEINFIIGDSLHKAIDDLNSLVVFRWNEDYIILENYETLTYSAGTKNDTFGIFVYTPAPEVDLSNADLKHILKNYDSIWGENGEIIVRD